MTGGDYSLPNMVGWLGIGCTLNWLNHTRMGTAQHCNNKWVGSGWSGLGYNVNAFWERSNHYFCLVYAKVEATEITNKMKEVVSGITLLFLLVGASWQGIVNKPIAGVHWSTYLVEWILSMISSEWQHCFNRHRIANTYSLVYIRTLLFGIKL